MLWHFAELFNALTKPNKNMHRPIPGVDYHVQTRKFGNIAAMSLAVEVVAQGIIVDSGLKSRVEWPQMSAMEFIPTLQCVDKI